MARQTAQATPLNQGWPAAAGESADASNPSREPLGRASPIGLKEVRKSAALSPEAILGVSGRPSYRDAAGGVRAPDGVLCNFHAMADRRHVSQRRRTMLGASA